ncbi:MAG: glycosyltransferase [Bacteroidetes bacterium]|nr:glycosyltransferase [Bacteroidota bacterium]
MNILIVVPPILRSENDKESWLTVPPLGYGGIENVVYSLINGLIYHGCKVSLIGAPGSNSFNGLSVIREAIGSEDIYSWIENHKNNFDIVHDHSCGLVFNKQHRITDFHYIATHHKTGKSPYLKNTVYLSYAQRRQANDNNSPIIRLPIMIENYIFNHQKEDYYLYLGRISEFKGVHEAASICEKLEAKLVVAGPNWEQNYFDDLLNNYSNTVEYVGEVFGLKKINLLSKARALFVLSRFTDGLWGDRWCEPGATIVGEAAASGTPVISSTNGCLSEIVVPEIGIQLEETEIEQNDVSKLTMPLPKAEHILRYAKENWNHKTIAEQYLILYKKIITGVTI